VVAFKAMEKVEAVPVREPVRLAAESVAGRAEPAPVQLAMPVTAPVAAEPARGFSGLTIHMPENPADANICDGCQ
jgi:hypothetical protein